jgi:hypothetical protein
VEDCPCFRCEQHRAYHHIEVINPFAKTWPTHRWHRQQDTPAGGEQTEDPQP